jgi:hypothetical protein
VKVWKDASEINMVHELPDKNLRELDIEMRKKPNFDKIKVDKKISKKNKK